MEKNTKTLEIKPLKEELECIDILNWVFVEKSFQGQTSCKDGPMKTRYKIMFYCKHHNKLIIRNVTEQ